MCPASAQTSQECALKAPLEEAVNRYLEGSRVSYSGTLLVEYAGEREFIEVASGSGGVGSQLRRLNVLPDGRSQLVTTRPPDTRDACSLNPYYSFGVEPGRPVAGRATYRLTVRPRDTLRFTQILDVDIESRVALRGLTVNPDGSILERYEFARIDIGPGAPVAAPEAPSDPTRYQFNALPPGFRIIQEGRDPVDFMVLSDGLATASVYVESQPRSLPSGEGVVLRGATLTYTRGSAASLLITVVGEVPVATARLLAQSVRIAGKS